MLPFALREVRKRKSRIKAQDYLGFALVGVLNVCISMLFLQFSIFYGKANLAALIVSSNPLFVTIFAAALISETITKLQIIELAIGLTGLILIILGESEAILSSANLGMAIIFGLIASTTFALSTVYSKKLVVQLGNMITLCSAFFMGSATLLIFSLLTHKALFFTPTLKNIGLMLYLGIFVSGIAYILYFNAMKVIGAARASMYFFLKPAFACTLAWLIHNEMLESVQLVGIVLIMLSLSRKYFASLIFGTPELKAAK